MAANARSLNGAIAVTRFGLGARPGDIQDAARDPQAWLKAQIRPQGADQPTAAPLPPIADPRETRAGGKTDAGADMATTDRRESQTGEPSLTPAVVQFVQGQSLPTMQSAFRVFADYQDQTKGLKGDPEERRRLVAPIFQAVGEEILARVQLACVTPAGFRERWTLFWANHFTMAAKGLPQTVAVGPFEREAIRPFVFGRFEDLLIASTRHPGMLLYLDQAQSIGPHSPAGLRRGGQGGLNENLSREIMELHTVGADAGYTQADVTELARALTGWSVGGAKGAAQEQGDFIYRASFHEPGDRTIMGVRYGDDGDRQALAVLKTLASRPQTAEHLARKIAVHFVADDPAPGLVAELKAAYLVSGGDLAHVASVLVSSPAAWDPAPRKFKTPYEFLVSSYRAAAALPHDPAKEIVQPLAALGQRPFTAPQPNGWSDIAADWAAPDAVVKRMTWAQNFASALCPNAAPPDAARAILGDRLSAKTLSFIARAESRPEAFALLLMSPEFQRR